jgi:NAD(P)-dependent dehydrogenase (short-subunit alcohol dehydrogenase family)
MIRHDRIPPRALLLGVLAIVLLAGPHPRAAADDSPWSGRTVLITGANRGLGLEFARQLHAAGADVIGTARSPEEADDLKALGVRVEQLDVADPASVAGLAERLDGVKLDALLNNAGIFPSRDRFEDHDMQDVERTFAVNTVGPFRVTQALLPHLRRGDRKLVMNMSSGLGSIANAGRGGSAGYRASKAALNMLTKVQAAELAEERFVFIAMSPGWVRTDMGGPQANLSPEESVRGMLATLAPLTAKDSGRYLGYDGSELPW